MQMITHVGYKLKRKLAIQHTLRIIIFGGLFLLVLYASIIASDFVLIWFPIVMMVYTLYDLYADYNGGTWWNEEKISQLKRVYWQIPSKLIEAELYFSNLTSVKALFTVPNGATNLVDIYDFVALFSKDNDAEPAIKIGFQYTQKRDLVELLTFLNNRWPEKCTDDIRDYLNDA
jgi:hypothetical protein